MIYEIISFHRASSRIACASPIRRSREARSTNGLSVEHLNRTTRARLSGKSFEERVCIVHYWSGREQYRPRHGRRLTRTNGDADEQAGHRPAVAGAFLDRSLSGRGSGSCAVPGRRSSFLVHSGGEFGLCNQCDFLGCAAAFRPACRSTGSPLALTGQRLPGGGGLVVRSTIGTLRCGVVGVRFEWAGCCGISSGGSPQSPLGQRRAPHNGDELVLGGRWARVRPGAARLTTAVYISWGTSGLLALLRPPESSRPYSAFLFTVRSRPGDVTTSRDRPWPVTTIRADVRNLERCDDLSVDRVLRFEHVPGALTLSTAGNSVPDRGAKH